MTDENLFEGKEQDKGFVIPAEAADLIGEGKKYATIEAALKGMKAAQEHIAKIEAENSEFRTKSEFNKESIEVKERELDQLRNEFLEVLKQTKQSDQTKAPVEDNNKGSNSEAQPQVDVSALVEQAINLRAQKERSESNKKEVIETLIAAHGSNASKMFYETGAAWGFDKDQMNKLAESNPTAVFKMFNIDKQNQRKNTQSMEFNKPVVPTREVNWNSDKDAVARIQELRRAYAAKYQQ